MGGNVKMNDLERKCHNFILQCYFGDMENPIDAAIDRAYVDMASHTLKGFAEHQYQEKWELRFEASSKIKKRWTFLTQKAIIPVGIASYVGNCRKSIPKRDCLMVKRRNG